MANIDFDETITFTNGKTVRNKKRWRFQAANFILTVFAMAIMSKYLNLNMKIGNLCCKNIIGVRLMIMLPN
ncbi:MAG: hypothetical protein Q4B82_03015 [Alysiella sp.]|uniref:hypothetical protein n=1 Tax=Alysiella sp. TaxID=1872483 RepID=UPI0026DB7E07|nr:hypothetical protein [Alysiella sp.]MDO4433537.1 hypothetical protein [Alysiella sp.]